MLDEPGREKKRKENGKKSLSKFDRKAYNDRIQNDFYSFLQNVYLQSTQAAQTVTVSMTTTVF